MKKDMQTYKNKSNECNTIFHDTYILYIITLGTEMKRAIQDRRSQVIKVANEIVDLMTCTI